MGHAIMDDVYEEDADYYNTDCTGHRLNVALSRACAWDEGFADWFALAVNKDPVLNLPTGNTDLDMPHWNTTGWDDGDRVEGRVAGALLDISDGALATGSDTWDRSSEGAGNIWTTFVRSGDAPNFGRVEIRSFRQFWDQRTSDKFNVATGGALATLYQNAIDYGYREPLGDYAELTRPVPIPDHRYTFTTNTAYWSAVALRPDDDYDLQLFDDATGVMLNSGPQPGSKIEFIAIDSNAGRRPVPHAYEARIVNRSSRAEFTQFPYTVELAQGAQTLGVGTSQTINMQSNDVVAVRDLRLEAGQKVTITVTPNNGQNPDVFVMASNPGFSTPSRGTAAASADTNDPGVAEELTFTASTTAYYGFVLLQKKGSSSGSYSVTVS
jgi:hypothetical protein